MIVVGYRNFDNLAPQVSGAPVHSIDLVGGSLFVVRQYDVNLAACAVGGNVFRPVHRRGAQQVSCAAGFN